MFTFRTRRRRWWLGAIATALVVSLAALLLRSMLEHTAFLVEGPLLAGLGLSSRADAWMSTLDPNETAANDRLGEI
jgi:hypothetical protein